MQAGSNELARFAAGPLESLRVQQENGADDIDLIVEARLFLERSLECEL